MDQLQTSARKLTGHNKYLRHKYSAFSKVPGGSCVHGYEAKELAKDQPAWTETRQTVYLQILDKTWLSIITYNNYDYVTS